MSATGQPDDERFMRMALDLARRGLGQTAPNPAVGAVLVNPLCGEIVGRGWTQPGGRPHAETEALRRAGDRARGARLYVTLEPCSHVGKTPPCADAVIAAGVASVVIGIEDPDPRVAGRGSRRIADAGIAVTRGVLADAARRVTRGHILRVTQRRPFTCLKIAVGRDGLIQPGAAGQPTWVTGEVARADGHLLRARFDAILVGSGTVRSDDPALTCRLPGLDHRSPLRVVLARDLDLPVTSRLATTANGVPVLAFAGDRLSTQGQAREAALEDQGVIVERVPVVDGALWLPAVTEALARRGITRLLVEGGPRVWAAFARSSLVDEIVLYTAGGGEEIATQIAHAQAALARYAPGLDMEVSHVSALARDLRITLQPRRGSSSNSPTA